MSAAFTSYHFSGSAITNSGRQAHALSWPALLLLEPFTLSTKVVDFGVHPCKEEFSRGSGNPCPLKLEDFLALSSDLGAHVLDFGTDAI
ncbi:hypothetical protein KIP88_38000 [Bradyrhizobium sp. SRL28]|uniref:hypothetical protein n=1 Tax=Bradyrhizobium sp. SRL28 TaxID=2836178 RepID=UPI001BDE4522|nr:hypothetical protein [Bradyrhizobium sp. SRL28]MBT1516252.1 hypothetical protein [Bradyrhizobium sp. SRL28]